MYRTDSSVPVFATNASGTTGRNAPRPSRYRSRDMGTGYGTSSGYATPRSYSRGNQPVARFRLV